MSKSKQTTTTAVGLVEGTPRLPAVQGRSATVTLANRLGVEPSDIFMQSLKSVAFKSPNVTTEQLMALVLVANAYKLNPFTRELYAFPDKGGGIVPIVSVDGWYRIINEHPQFDGLEYVEGIDDVLGRYGECTVYRKDRSHPLCLREYLNECRRATDPWKMNPSRMMRHRTIIQTARVAFGFAGIYEPDEAERIIAGEAAAASVSSSVKGEAKLRAALGPPLTQENVVSVPQPLGDMALTLDEPAPVAIDSPALLGDDDEARALAEDAQRMFAEDEDVPV